jgi:hypothetical protein
MNRGVQIILNRMESNPDEFTKGHSINNPGRWDWLLAQITRRVEHCHRSDSNYRIELPFLSNDEVDTLYDKFMSIQGDAFTHRIMRELLEEEKAGMEYEYDNIADAVRYRTAAKKMVVPLYALENHLGIAPNGKDR